MTLIGYIVAFIVFSVVGLSALHTPETPMRNPHRKANYIVQRRPQSNSWYVALEILDGKHCWCRGWNIRFGDEDHVLRSLLECINAGELPTMRDYVFLRRRLMHELRPCWFQDRYDRLRSRV